jgi:hypothetical protein
MRTELELFGRRISVATRARRRRLVLLFYGVFAVLLVASCLGGFMSPGGSGWATIEFTILLAPILGGYFARIGLLSSGRGIVAPFKPQKVLRYPASASLLRPESLLHPVVDIDPELRVDERALRRRDHAHYLSHEALGTVIGIAFLVAYLRNTGLLKDVQIAGSASGIMGGVVYLLLQVAYVLSMTLPAAILLWTEPDMEDPNAR